MTSEKLILIDGDSIAYIAGTAETVKDMQGMVDSLMQRILSNTWEGKYELYIESGAGDKNIFRNHVATSRPYKGNRTSEKPALLDDAKIYMYLKYGAKPQTYLESEDMVSIRAYEHGLENVIIASIDKDMRQIPTYFYDYNKERRFKITKEEAAYNFWLQVLAGDQTDNIPGLPGIGIKKAENILRPIPKDDKSLALRVAMAYVREGFNFSYFVEQCRLLRMLTSYVDVYNPPINAEEFELLEIFID